MVMNKSIIVKMFSKYYENKEKVKGFNAKLIRIDDEDDFIFKVSVDENISYQIDSVIIYLYETVHEFLNIIGYNEFLYDIQIEGELKKVYIGDDLRNDIESVLSKINTVIMKKDLDVIKLHVNHVSSSVEITEKGSVKIINYVKPISGEECVGFNMSDCKQIDVDLAVDTYLKYRYRRKYDDSDYNYLSIDELMGKYVLFTDDNQVIYTLTEFV
jgi:hypothetical protein